MFEIQHIQPGFLVLALAADVDTCLAFQAHSLVYIQGK